MQELVQARRVCAVCRGEKPVSGVWYLLPPRGGPSRFVCESCFAPNAVA